MSNRSLLWIVILVIANFGASPASGSDRLLGVQSARVMSQSMPWIAQETGIFRKYNLEFPLVYIGSSPLATAAMLGGDAQMMIDGGLGTVRAVVQGNNELVFIAGIKNYLTQSILAKPEIKRLEDLRGKKVGVTRIGSTTHYFALQAFKRRNMEAGRDYVMIQTGGAPEMLAALLSGAIEAGTMTAPWDTRAIAEGFHYVVFGPDLRLPQVAVSFITRRTLIARSSPVIAQFMRAMAEAAKILHTEKKSPSGCSENTCALTTARSWKPATTLRSKRWSRAWNSSWTRCKRSSTTWRKRTRAPSKSKPWISTTAGSWTRWKRAVSSRSCGAARRIDERQFGL
jgi:ABC-type nitrate/sulfonate/bicarbonate transport system substrate-binding protein